MADKAVRKHYITFMSPGTLFSETSDKEVDSWDVKQAVQMAKSIKERYNATPYGFYFKTFITHPPIDDGEGGTLNVQPKQVADSGRYFLGGKLESFDDVEKRNDTNEEILRSNMRANDWAWVCVVTHKYKSTQPFEEKDSLVDAETGEILFRGSDPDLMAYRKVAKAKFDEYYAPYRR